MPYFDIKCEVEDPSSGGSKFVFDASDPDSNTTVFCAVPLQTITADTTDFDCDWTCAPGWTKYNDGTVDEEGNTSYKCHLPKSPILTVVNDGTVTTQADCTANAVWSDVAAGHLIGEAGGATCVQHAMHGGADLTVTSTATLVDVATLGTYDVTYTCSDTNADPKGELDEHNNYKMEDNTLQTVTKDREVIIADTIIPVCTLPANTATITIEASFPYDPLDLAPTCTDTMGFTGDTCLTGDDLSTSADLLSTDVDVEKIDDYTVTFTVVDLAGNSAATLTRTVRVIDSLKPIIGLNFDTESKPRRVSTHLGGESTAEYGGAKQSPSAAENHLNPTRSHVGWINPALMSEHGTNSLLLIAAAFASVAGVAFFVIQSSSRSDIVDLI
jgi:hypothetical protein